MPSLPAEDPSYEAEALGTRRRLLVAMFGISALWAFWILVSYSRSVEQRVFQRGGFGWLVLPMLVLGGILAISTAVGLQKRRGIAFWTGLSGIAIGLLWTIASWFFTYNFSYLAAYTHASAMAERGIPVPAWLVNLRFSSLWISLSHFGMALFLYAAARLLFMIRPGLREEAWAPADALPIIESTLRSVGNAVDELVKRAAPPPPPHPYQKAPSQQPAARRVALGVPTSRPDPPIPRVLNADRTKALHGSGGWLAVLAWWISGSTLVGAALRGLGGFAPPDFVLLPLFLVAGLATYSLVRCRPNAIRRVKTFLVCDLLQPFATVAVAKLFSFYFLDSGSPVPDLFGVILLWHLTWDAGWWLYLVNSERVRLTFGNLPAPHSEPPPPRREVSVQLTPRASASLELPRPPMRALPILPDELPPVSPGEKLRTLPRAFQGSSNRADPGGSPWPAFVSFLALVIVAAVAGLSRDRPATTTVPTGGPRQAPAVASTPATAGTPTLFKKAYSFSTCPGLEALSFSPDGALLAGACPGTETTVFWSTGMGLETTLRGPEGFAAAVEFSPDSLSLATLARGGVVRLWDPRKGSRLQELRDSAENVSSPFPSWRSVLRFSPDGKLLAAAGNDLFVRLYTIPEGTIFRLGPLANPVVTMAFSPDGGTLAVATDSGPVDCFDPASGRFLRRLSGHDIGVESLAFSPDSELLAGAGWGRKTTLWEVRTGALRAEIREPGLPLFVDFSADGSRILTTSLDVPGFYGLDGWPVTSRGFGARKIWAPSYSRKAGRLVLSSAEHDVEVYEKEQTPVFLSPRPWPTAQTVRDTSCSAISPDGTRVATGYSSGSIKVWRLPRKL